MKAPGVFCRVGPRFGVGLSAVSGSTGARSLDHSTSWGLRRASFLLVCAVLCMFYRWEYGSCAAVNILPGLKAKTIWYYFFAEPNQTKPNQYLELGTLADKLDGDAEEAANGSAFARRQKRTKKYQDFYMVTCCSVVWCSDAGVFMTDFAFALSHYCWRSDSRKERSKEVGHGGFVHGFVARLVQRCFGFVVESRAR